MFPCFSPSGCVHVGPPTPAMPSTVWTVQTVPFWSTWVRWSGSVPRWSGGTTAVHPHNTHTRQRLQRDRWGGHTHITNSDVTNNHRSWWNSLAVNECWTGSGNVARTASEFKYWLLLLYTKQVVHEHFRTKDQFKLNEESEWNGQDFNKVNY